MPKSRSKSKTRTTPKPKSKTKSKTVVKPPTANPGKLIKNTEYALHKDDYALVMSVDVAKDEKVPEIKSVHLASFTFKPSKVKVSSKSRTTTKTKSKSKSRAKK